MSTTAKKTTKKKTALAGAMKTEKKLSKKAQEIYSIWDEAQKLGKKLFEQGKLKPFNRKEIYGN